VSSVNIPPVTAGTEKLTALSVVDRYQAVRKLVVLGKDRGYLSYDEINELLPDEVKSSALEIERVFAALESRGIDLVDADTREQLRDLERLSLGRSARQTPVGQEFSTPLHPPTEPPATVAAQADPDHTNDQHPFPVALWAAEWSDGRLSVLTAPDLERAHALVTRQVRTSQAYWPAAEECELADLRPVHSLMFRAASRSRDNEPAEGQLWIEQRQVTWTAPHKGPRVRRPIEKTTGTPRPWFLETPVPCELWSYVTPGNEMAVYACVGFRMARRLAREDFGPEVRRSDIESVIERLEMHLAPNDEGYAPTCYRLWIEGQMVGWPRPTPRLPPPSGPPWPAPAEARVAIPVREQTDACSPDR
jgi:hypothetical protein